MTDRSAAADSLGPPPGRRLTCARCGAFFGCSLDGGCWCAAEPYRLPMPEAGMETEDCMCPTCLRSVAAARRS